MICFCCYDAHQDHIRRKGFVAWYALYRNLSFGNWLIHMLAHNLERWDVDLVQPLVFKIGILDAPHEAGILFWRWDPWNNILRRKLKEAGRL